MHSRTLRLTRQEKAVYGISIPFPLNHAARLCCCRALFSRPFSIVSFVFKAKAPDPLCWNTLRNWMQTPTPGSCWRRTPVRWGARKLHVSGRCPAGLGPDWERLSQQPGLVRHTSPGVHRGLPPCGDSPHHREEDGSTAQQVDQKQRILPQAILRSPLLSGLYDDVGHVRQNLQDTRSG